MASDRPEIDDLLAHSRIHDWIAEQYSFALSEQDEHHGPLPPPSLRESCVLPPEFDPFVASPVTPQRGVDYDDAHEYLVQEMNSWRVSSTRNKPLPSPPAVQRRLPLVEDDASGLPWCSPPSPPASPRIAPKHFELPANTARKRPSLPLLSTAAANAGAVSVSGSEYSPDLDDDERHMLTTSASYASLRTRASQVPPSPTLSRYRQGRFPSISTTLSALPPIPPTPTVPYTPTTPTSAQAHCRTPSTPRFAPTPPLTTSSSFSSTPSQIHLPSLSSKPSLASLRHRPSIPELHTPVDEAPLPLPRPRPRPARDGPSDVGLLNPALPTAEQSRWSIATSTDGTTPRIAAAPVTPSKPKSFRTRLLSAVSRLSKKPSALNLAAPPPTPMTPATPSRMVPHSRTASQVSSVELGYCSNVRDADDPFARPPPPPAVDDYAEFLARASSTDIPQDGTGSYITADASYLTSVASYVTSSPSRAVGIVTAAPSVTEFGTGHNGDPADATIRAEHEKRKKNRMSWASTKSASRARSKRLVLTGLVAAPGAKIGEIKPETLNAQEQAVYVWCEAFGEIRKTTRTPESTLAIEWKAPGIAEMVHAIQDRVNIPGAGIISLSLAEGRRKLF